MADIICRWRNGTPKTVVELVNKLPHNKMKVPRFREKMEAVWPGFFHSPYQLACQLALYCEAEDGYYYPRYDHDIDLVEARRYLEHWINRYYIPNPYTGDDGFKDLDCPTYVIKSLYEYVLEHPDTDYATAYKACFHDDVKNNDDIMRNYINRFSKVLSFSKEGKISVTDINPNIIFGFMDKNNKKEFFDNLALPHEVSLMEVYNKADVSQRQKMFYNYMIQKGLAKSSAQQYTYSHPACPDVLDVIKQVSHKNNLFEVIDVVAVKKIYNTILNLPVNLTRGHALSAAIGNYNDFIDYLETKKVSDENYEMVDSDSDSENKQDLTNFKHLLEYFCAHLQYIVTNDTNVKGYEEYIKPVIDNGTFKKSGQGWNGDGIQRLIADWEKYTLGIVCINVYGGSFKSNGTYLHWNGTGHNITPVWDGDNIKYLQCVEFYEKPKNRWEPQDIKFTMDELGLYDGKEPNENIKTLYDAFVAMLLNDQGASDTPVEQAPLDFSDYKPSQIIYYGAPGTGKSNTIKEKELAGLQCIRTTFHPDSDYATFVGCYKPHCDPQTHELTYKFVEQAFLETYQQAWQQPNQEIALVIEEINRGNCAQIFGDIFQLLDRDKDGWSTYPIKADTDISEHLEALGISGYSETMVKHYGEKKAGYGYLALPPNMSILATMNTSDQSLFPIDSAFKRRWDWKYIPINYSKDNWSIDVKNEHYSWSSFLKAINNVVAEVTEKEDKMLGFFFVNAKSTNGHINANTFVSKVVFYLWNDVFKDYDIHTKILNGAKAEEFAFRRFFNDEGNANEDLVEKLLKNLEVEKFVEAHNEPVANPDQNQANPIDQVKEPEPATLTAAVPNSIKEAFDNNWPNITNGNGREEFKNYLRDMGLQQIFERKIKRGSNGSSIIVDDQDHLDDSNWKQMDGYWVYDNFTLEQMKTVLNWVKSQLSEE